MEIFDSNKEFSVAVEYCARWYFTYYFHVARTKILEKYPKAKVTGESIPGRTGCLEIIVNGKDKVFSKLNGDGFLTDEKIPKMLMNLKKIVEA